jgi:hypothetical protein
MSELGKKCEKLVTHIKGGHWTSLYQPKCHFDVYSGNGTRLQVAWSKVIDGRFWHWDPSNKLFPNRYDRLILVGGHIGKTNLVRRSIEN